MAYITIKAHDFENTKMIDLVAEIDQYGKVLKVSDYNGNELEINHDGTVTFNKTRWHIPVKADLK
ncbi:hypothetical protein [Acinetobacter nosocomialis]|uniref:hypothetical protein n=1 Tax=Acinetobacter nosocomialis TaxID=106654 RepID=UPI001B8183ED|nr:hypothetical protein [Acinetobacter nosocomialis]MBR7715545.1 hypothetical protein [Acinetobacter nosocomialis]